MSQLSQQQQQQGSPPILSNTPGGGSGNNPDYLGMGGMSYVGGGLGTGGNSGAGLLASQAVAAAQYGFLYNQKMQGGLDSEWF